MNGVATSEQVGPGQERGHYSPFRRSAGLIFVSGQLPGNGGDAHTTPFESQVRAAMRSVLRVLADAGACKDDLVSVTVYLADVRLWAEFNRIYAGIMGGAEPSRTVVPVMDLHHGYLVEISAIATAPPAAVNF